MGKPRLPREHGTERGYQQHGTDRTVPGNGCLTAHRYFVTARKQRGRCAAGLGWPLVVRRG